MPTKQREKTPQQHRRIFGLASPKAKAAGESVTDYLATIIAPVTSRRTTSVKTLTFDEANDVIKALGGSPLSAYGQSKRTENYRKQQAGIKSIETDAHLLLIDELAVKLGWDADRLRGFCQRQIKKDLPTTTEEGNKVVEGLKAMVKRNVVAFPGGNTSGSESAPQQPAFRRVA